MSPLAWLGLGLGMTAYALATFWGWHLGPKLQQRSWVRSQLLLLTCGIWLELVFFDLLPSTQPTLMGILGFRMATLFSLILFFTPVILMSGLHSFVGWAPSGRLRLGAFTLQNMLEGVLIYSLCRVNLWLGTAYLFLTAPHALVEAMTIRDLSRPAKAGTWLWLVLGNLAGLGLGFVLIEGMGSLISLAVFNQLMAGYLFYVAFVDLYQEVVRQAKRPIIPYAVFLGMGLMGLLNVLV